MRKTLTILGLAAAALVMFTNDASAQRRGGYRGGGGSAYHSGYGAYHSGYGSQGNYHSGYYHNSAYPYIALGLNYLGRGYGYGYGYPSYGNSDYYSDYYYPTYSYYSQPTYVYPPPTNYATDTRQSYYNDPNAATIVVMVPDANAQVWFDDTLTSQRGTQRTYTTPGLQQSGTYTIKARLNVGDRVMDQQRVVTVQPGQSVTVDFRGEQVINPRPAQPAPPPNPVRPVQPPVQP